MFLPNISPTTILLGDFNIPISHTVSQPNRLIDLLDTFNLHQHVSAPTHNRGNLIDLIITNKHSKLTTGHSICPLFSDHYAILFNISHPKPNRPSNTRTIRKLHNICIPDFINDISNIPITTSAALNDSLIAILDKHAPESTKTSISRPDSSWYNQKLLKQKRSLRTAESVHRNHHTPDLLLKYNMLKNQYRKQIISAKNAHISMKFNLLENDSKSIHRLSAKLLGRSLNAPHGNP